MFAVGLFERRRIQRLATGIDANDICALQIARRKRLTGVPYEQILKCCRPKTGGIVNGYEFQSETTQFVDLPGEIWKPFYLKDFIALRALPKTVRNKETAIEARKKYRAKRKEEQALMKKH